MPDWFAEAFSIHFHIAGLTDQRLAAEKFWRLVVLHERFPSPDTPSLTGDTGQRDLCPKGHNLQVIGGRLRDNLYHCTPCNQHFTCMDGEYVEWTGP